MRYFDYHISYWSEKRTIFKVKGHFYGDLIFLSIVLEKNQNLEYYIFLTFFNNFNFLAIRTSIILETAEKRFITKVYMIEGWAVFVLFMSMNFLKQLKLLNGHFHTVFPNLKQMFNDCYSLTYLAFEQRATKKKSRCSYVLIGERSESVVKGPLQRGIGFWNNARWYFGWNGLRFRVKQGCL